MGTVHDVAQGEGGEQGDVMFVISWRGEHNLFRSSSLRGGDDVPSVEKGVKILGTPLGHPEYVSHQLRVVRGPSRRADGLGSVFTLRGCPYKESFFQDFKHTRRRSTRSARSQRS